MIFKPGVERISLNGPVTILFNKGVCPNEISEGPLEPNRHPEPVNILTKERKYFHWLLHGPKHILEILSDVSTHIILWTDDEVEVRVVREGG